MHDYEFVSHVYQDMTPAGHVDWFLSIPVILLCTIAGLGALFFLLGSGLRWLGRARRAEASVRDDSALAPGDVAVRGTVEHLPGAGGAVRLEISQEGDESQSSGDWVVSWTEKERRMLVHPFLIRLAAGGRVLVHPDQHVFLADALDGVVRVNRAARVRIAELTPGETVTATGRLSAVPSGAARHGESWALHPTGREPMILSTEPLGARFKSRARARLLCALIGGALFIVPQLFLIGFHLRTIAGHVEYGNVLGQDNDGAVTLVFADGRRFSQTLYPERIQLPATMSAMRVRSVPWATSLGRYPTTHWGPLAGVATAALVLLILMFVLPSRWYEKPTVRDQALGRLDEGAPAVPGGPAGPPAATTLPQNRLHPLLIAVIVLSLAIGAAAGAYMIFVAGPEMDETYVAADAWLHLVRSGNLDAAYAAAHPSFDRNDRMWLAQSERIRASVMTEWSHLTIGFDDDACIGGGLQPDGAQIVIRMLKVNGQWRVSDAANDLDDVPGCEGLFDI